LQLPIVPLRGTIERAVRHPRIYGEGGAATGERVTRSSPVRCPFWIRLLFVIVIIAAYAQLATWLPNFGR
jgi:hypothetical protein